MRIVKQQGGRVEEKRVLIVTWLVFRSSLPEEFCKKGVLKNVAKFTEKQLCQFLITFLSKKDTPE